MDSTRYYKPTGHAPFGGIVSASEFGVLAAIICGALYGIIDYYNPFIYFNFAGACAVAYAVAAALKMRFHSGRIRSRLVKVSTGVFCGMLGIYCAWWSWLAALSEWNLIFLNPIDLPAIISELAKEGVWKIKGFTPTGWLLYIVWAIEAGIILLASGGLALDDEIPFCEDCNQWTEPVGDPIPISWFDEEELQQSLKAGTFSRTYNARLDELRQPLEAEDYDVLLDAIGEHVAQSQQDFLIKPYMCPNCEGSCYLTIIQVTDEEVSAVIENLVVGLSVIEAISARAEQAIAAASVEDDRLIPGITDSSTGC
jgi:hypothetical protein